MNGVKCAYTESMGVPQTFLAFPFSSKPMFSLPSELCKVATKLPHYGTHIIIFSTFFGLEPHEKLPFLCGPDVVNASILLRFVTLQLVAWWTFHPGLCMATERWKSTRPVRS